MSYIQINNAHKSFGSLTVIDDLNLNVEKGSLVTLLGPSGCGKSTLLRCIAGLETLNQGSIILNNQDITYLKPQKRRIAMVFQNYALFPNMTVADNVEFGLKIKKVSLEERLTKVKDVLDLVELTSFAQQKPESLSGGQKQRVALARAMMIEPKIIGYDEPTSALDPELRLEVEKLILKNRELGITQIVVTHDLQFAENIADNILKVEPR